MKVGFYLTQSGSIDWNVPNRYSQVEKIGGGTFSNVW